MSKANGFKFKQFFIAHDKCAMKVNTDGILLGAWADISRCQHILDIGTGTGLVAIMLAQRTTENCYVTALELETSAFQQSVENVQNCAWRERITVQQGDLMQTEFLPKFNLIVSNPPYFFDSLATRTEARNLARTATASHFAWLKQAKKWLNEKGKITFILPFAAGEKLICDSQTSGLFCIEICKIITKVGQAPKRMIVTFSNEKQARTEKTLTIYNRENQYTEEYIQLTKGFYLNM